MRPPLVLCARTLVARGTSSLAEAERAEYDETGERGLCESAKRVWE